MTATTAEYFITSDQIAEYAQVFYNSKRTPLFIGPPGIAKTAFVRQAARELAVQYGTPFIPVRELHLASVSEVDVRGYLIPDGNKAVFTEPEFFAITRQHERGILFLDEFVQASHEVQKAIAPLILEGRIGEYVLPPGWVVMLAGNGLGDNAGANTLLSHIVNRVCIVHTRAPDVDEWVTWAASDEAKIPFELIAFAKVRPNVVFSPPKIDELAPDEAFCTPRSLHALGDIANAFPGGTRGMVASTAGMAFMCGTVGAPAASEISSFIRMAINLPPFEMVVSDPERTPIPDALDQQYAMVMMCAVRASLEQATPVMTYLKRFDNNLTLTGLASLARRDKQFTHSPAVLSWIMANQELLKKFSKYISKAVNQ